MHVNSLFSISYHCYSFFVSCSPVAPAKATSVCLVFAIFHVDHPNLVRPPAFVLELKTPIWQPLESRSCRTRIIISARQMFLDLSFLVYIPSFSIGLVEVHETHPVNAYGTYVCMSEVSNSPYFPCTSGERI